MKTMFTFALALGISTLAFGTMALATPAVGDDAKFDVTITTSSGSTAGTLEVSLTAYDSTSDSYTEHSVFTQNGSSQSSDQTVASSNLLSDAVLNNLSTVCPQNGGKLTSVTVPAGTFSACDFTVSQTGETGNVWIGAVPFGILEQNITIEGENVTMSLQSFVAGH